MNSVTNISSAREYFNELQCIISRVSHQAIDDLADILVKAYEARRTVYIFGNGGSASLASHLACDLGKGTAHCNGGKRFRVMALTDNIPALTAWANDFGYEDVFSEQLRNFVQADDVAFAISGSGNSKNVLNALHVARDAGAKTIGITGFEGGEMKHLCDFCVIVPCNNMQIVEDVHLAAAHSIYRIVHSRITRHALATSSSA